ncbi:MAG TPA: hypothetical protein VEJ23_05165 [Solirubrobacteraceae bacterium]|nr:hypothetical protein [Solirubrobacteraceae bacterium]
MSGLGPIDVTMLAGARQLLSFHAGELPQRDDLCGAFCGALALHAAGIDSRGGEPVDQDLLAQAAGSVVSRLRDPASLPAGEQGRRDYRLPPPQIDEPGLSGTTAEGLVGAIERVSDDQLAAIPYSGPWSAEALDGMFEVAATLARPVTLVVNLATRDLWGSHPRPDQLLAYLLDGEQTGPPPDWDVGHFACVVGRARGPGGHLYAVADTYPSLGSAGVHLQPRERLALALERPGMAPGGMIVVASPAEVQLVRAGAARLGLAEQPWDNGTISRATLT